MSNVVSGKTWVLDATGSVYTNRVKIKTIIWTGISTNGDDLLINESSGGQIILSIKGGANNPFSVEVNRWYDGIYLTTLDSGTVNIILAD